MAAVNDRGRQSFSKGGGTSDRPLRRAGALVLLFGLVLAGGAAAAPTRDRPTPSGLPVPRWVSLKFGTVNARQGPGDDYPAVWTYRVKRLPVQVVAETREWRKICDPDGASAWVHRRTVDGVRTAFRVKTGNLPLLSRPEAGGKVRAYLAGRSTADLDKCEDGWCRVRAGGVRGWAPEKELWGAGEAARCR